MIFALDPLFLGDAGTLEVVLIVILKVLVAFTVLLITVMLYIWWMRKFISDMQNRVGPSRAGPFGILQTLADGIKLFFKEDLIPNKADKSTNYPLLQYIGCKCKQPKKHFLLLFFLK